MDVKALGYVGVRSPRAEEWRTFGPDVLGMPVSDGPDGSIRMRMDERAWRIAVHGGEKNEIAYIGWELASPQALEAAYTELENTGLGPRHGTDEECAVRGVKDIVHVQDPSGNRLELFHGAATDAAFQPARQISGFKTGEMGLGHIVVGVGRDAFAGCRAFYEEVLGFKLSDTFDMPHMSMVFLHVNPRHHSIALGTQTIGLHHIMVEVQQMDDVGSTFDLCQQKGVPLSRALGKHSNDWMFSFYMETPSGFDIEYGWNGRQIDDAAWEPVALKTTSFWGHQFLGERAKQMEEMRRRAQAAAAGAR